VFKCFIFIKIIKRSYIKQNFFLKHKKYWCQKFSSKGGSVVYKTTKGMRVYNAMVLYQMLKVSKQSNKRLYEPVFWAHNANS